MSSTKKGLVVITGASKGIGKAIVEKFCKEGFPVLACARDQSGLDDLATTTSSLPGPLEVAAVDMSIRSEVERFTALANGREESIEILVNNVGVFIPGNILDEPEGQLEKQIETNLYSAYYLTRALVGRMKAQGSGHIFNICSTASLAPYQGGSSYSISKYALLGFSHNLREELKSSQVRVTAILPGNTLTPSWGETDIPEDRFIKADDIAESVYAVNQLSPNSTVEELLIHPQQKA